MGRLILSGIGISLGIATWPISLPLLLVVWLLSRSPQKAAAPQEIQPQAQPQGQPVLGSLAASQLAIVAERNRQHHAAHLERCLDR